MSFFTQAPVRRLPHDRIGLRVILVAHAAVSRSFELLREESYPLGSAKENDITERLEDKLENVLRHDASVEGFNTVTFGKVTRANELTNYNFTKKSKKPDLVFGLKREGRLDLLQTHDALFAECKPVGKSHRLRAHYCAVEVDCSGIERFVIGDYAWTMEQGMMIGFVRDGFQIKPHLSRVLKDKERRAKLGYPSAPRAVCSAPAGTGAEMLHSTIHRRGFKWANGKPATPITLYHSWHSCS